MNTKTVLPGMILTAMLLFVLGARAQVVANAPAVPQRFYRLRWP